MLHSMVIDNFLPDFEIIRAWADHARYEDSKNPYDHLDYVGIANACPSAALEISLKAWFHPNLKLVHSMVRLSLEGAPVPYQAHADSFMGSRFTAIVYLNRPEHCRGGTALLKHIESGAVKDSDGTAWREDESNPDAWEVLTLCPMQTNRAFCYRSELLHRSEPLGGFGKSAHDGRLVLIGLFDV